MADIGTTLRETRMRARIDISEVEARTKIRAKYLRAIENEEWDLLPGPVYVKSFLKTYGDFLGLDSRLLIDEFKRRYERPSDHDLRPLSTLSRERERAARGPMLPPWALIGGVVVALVAILFAVGSLSGKSGPSTPAAPRTHHPAVRHHQTPSVTTPHRPVAPTAPAVAKLTLVPTSPVYVCVIDSHGHKLINGQTFSPGHTIPIARGAKLYLTLGNNAVQMKVNNKTIPVTASAKAINFEVTPTGARLLTKAPPVLCT
jgi:cytoskeleton protein RodZ